MTQTIARPTQDIDFASLIRDQDFMPAPPPVRAAPQHIGPDTYLIHSVTHALGAPLSIYLNSLVIAGDEPIIVDTGTVANRHQWLNDVFGIVEPKDVRWIYLSHDDHDHTGNLVEALSLCPNATLVTTWSMVERIGNAFNLPLERMRWVNDGDSFDAGNRRLTAVRPPNFDSPTTRGLYDHRSGVYWAVDSFAAPCPGDPVPTVADLDLDFWRDGMAMVEHNAVSVWLRMVDVDRYVASVERVRALGLTAIAAAHSPAIPQPLVDTALDLARELPLIPPPPVPDQFALEAILSGGEHN